MGNHLRGGQPQRAQRQHGQKTLDLILSTALVTQGSSPLHITAAMAAQSCDRGKSQNPHVFNPKGSLHITAGHFPGVHPAGEAKPNPCFKYNTTEVGQAQIFQFPEDFFGGGERGGNSSPLGLKHTSKPGLLWGAHNQVLRALLYHQPPLAIAGALLGHLRQASAISG